MLKNNSSPLLIAFSLFFTFLCCLSTKSSSLGKGENVFVRVKLDESVHLLKRMRERLLRRNGITLLLLQLVLYNVHLRTNYSDVAHMLFRCVRLSSFLLESMLASVSGF